MSATTNGHHVAPERLAALAAGCLLIDDARLYGLIDGGPQVDRARCGQVLAELERAGVVPDEGDAAAAAIELMAELGMVRP
jgi:hypothetical protein